MEVVSPNVHIASTMPLQGGGIFITGSSTTVTITSSSIHDNTAVLVSAHTVLNLLKHSSIAQLEVPNMEIKLIAQFGRAAAS